MVRALPSGLVTFCFTDIEGSTELHARTTEAEYATLLERHRVILRQTWAEHRGIEVSTEGDGCFVAFGDARDALEASGSAQQRLAAEQWPPGREVRVRIGVHTGEAVPTTDDDYSAYAVHQAARVAAAGHGGQVVVSPATATASGSDRLRRIGRFRVRDFAEPVELFELLIEGAERLFPPLRTVRALDPVAAIDVPEFLRVEGLGRLHGRGVELDTGRQALSAAVTGAHPCVVVGGEPGVGKTRLVAELAADARRLGMVVLGGRCASDVANPFGPFTEAFRRALPALDRASMRAWLGRWPEELVRILPELPDLLPDLGSPLASDPATERWRLMDAIVSALASLARPSGLVLVVDDAQWASPATASVTRHLLTSPDAVGVVLLVTYRDTELEVASAWTDLRAELRRTGTVHVVLRGLDDVAMAGLVVDVGGDEILGADARFVSGLTRATAGNPFFAGELVRHMVERGDVPTDNRDLPFEPDADRDGLPIEVRDVIGQRIRLLGELPVSVLQAGAVVGDHFHVDGVRAILGSECDPLDALETAARAGLVVEVATDRWRFVHELVQSAVYREMSKSRRGRCHRRVAEWLTSTDDDGELVEASVVARHWGAASGRDAAGHAARWWLRAGDDAMSRLAPAEAAAHFAAALDHSASAGASAFDEAERIAALVALGTAQHRVGDPGSVAVLLAAAESARDLDLPVLMAMALVASSRGFWNTLGAADDQRVRLVEESLSRLQAGDGALRARLLAMLAAELLFHPRRDDRFAIADTSLQTARSVDDDAVTFDVMTHRFLSTAVPERLDRYWLETAELPVLADRIGDPHRGVLAILVRCFIGGLSGHGAEVPALAAMATDKADELGQPMLGWLAGSMRVASCIAAGRVEDAERFAYDAFTLGQRAGEADAFGWYGGQLAGIRMEQGRLGEVLDVIAGFAAATPQMPVWSAFLAFALCEEQRLHEARHVFDGLAREAFSNLPYDQLWVAAMCLAAEVCRHVGERHEAEELYDRLAPWEMLSASVSVFSIGSVARSLGLLAAQRGDLDAAEAHFVRAMERNTADGLVMWAATARLDLAECRAARGGAGDLAGSVTLVHHVLRDLDGLGDGRVRRRAYAMLGEVAPE